MGWKLNKVRVQDSDCLTAASETVYYQTANFGWTPPGPPSLSLFSIFFCPHPRAVLDCDLYCGRSETGKVTVTIMRRAFPVVSFGPTRQPHVLQGRHQANERGIRDILTT